MDNKSKEDADWTGKVLDVLSAVGQKINEVVEKNPDVVDRAMGVVRRYDEQVKKHLQDLQSKEFVKKGKERTVTDVRELEDEILAELELKAKRLKKRIKLLKQQHKKFL